MFLIVAIAGESPAQNFAPREKPQVAALALPTGPAADWRQWDSFLTTIVKKLGQDLGEQQREQLRELFLDSRYQLVQSFSSGI